jgi:hypothetical protein
MSNLCRPGFISSTVLGIASLAFSFVSNAGNDVIPGAETTVQSQALPPLPPDVTELRFIEFFKLPIGSLGLEATEKLLSLHEKRVRLLGYMVREEAPAPGVFILASLPVNAAEVADGPADDLPPTATFVHVTVNADQAVPYTPGLLLLTGVLEVGAKDESLDRVSTVRLYLDPPPAASQAPQVESPSRLK